MIVFLFDTIYLGTDIKKVTNFTRNIYFYNSMKKFKEFSSKDLGDNIFVRWGGANSVRQKGDKNRESITWHYPPDSRGIYAFPLKGIERFLAGHRMKEHYSRIKFEEDLWHHLTDHVKPKDVIKREGSWILTSHSVWQKAFKKEMLDMKLKGWGGKINHDKETISTLTFYWWYYMSHRYSYVNKENSSSTDPILDARFKRYVNREVPTKADLEDADFVQWSNHGDGKENSWFMTYHEYKTDGKGNTKGGYGGDHLEVFLPNVK